VNGRISFKKTFVLLYILAVSLAGHLSARDYYWETPRPVTDSDSRFPVVVSNGTAAVLLYEDVDTEQSQTWIAIQKPVNQTLWSKPQRIAGPFDYSGEVPDLFSAAMSSDGAIAVVVLTSAKSIGVYLSHDGGLSFAFHELPRQTQPVVGPRIFASSAGGFMLFAALGENESFSLLSAESAHGDSWTALHQFGPAASLTNPFVPCLTAVPGGDMVVFQTQYNSGTRLSYQLYSTVSTDNLKSWSPAVLVTGAESFPSSSAGVFTNYHNQRPVLYSDGVHRYLAWERTYYTSEYAHIWVAELSSLGTITGEAEEITTSGNAHRPVFYLLDGTLSLVWFDNRRGTDSVYTAEKNGILWNETRLASQSQSETFAFPVITSGELSFIWQQNSSGKNSSPRIYLLQPDRSVKPASISAQSFTVGKRSTAEKVTARVILPDDSSGIAGYSWIWTQNEHDEPPEEFMRLPSELNIQGLAEADGPWYFKVRVTDYAGNWSSSSSLAYVRDTTPPKPPVILPSASDKFGFLESNSFAMNWHANDADDDIAGYSWSLQYIAPLDHAITETERHPITLSDGEVESQLSSLLVRYSDAAAKAPVPPRRNQGDQTSVSYRNYANGLYTFSVAAVDSVGNIGAPSVVTVVLNKYVPSTGIIAVNPVVDAFGTMSLSILGYGYSYEGSITEIYIDRDGTAPYDRELYASRGDFRVISDERITGIKLSGIEPGTYRIGLLHSDRGLYFSGRMLTISESGTVKIENHYEYEPDWLPVTQVYRYHVQVGTLLAWILCALALIGFFAAVRALASAAHDAVTVKYEVQALLTGDSMPEEKKKKAVVLAKKGASLKVKLVLFTTFLVLMIVLLVSVPLGIIMTHTQEQTLGRGLEERINVLMESLSSGVHAYLPTQNVLELSYLPGQTSSLEEVQYATITGLSASGTNTNPDFVWATNDSNISSKIDSAALSYGVSRLTSDSISEISAKCSVLNEEAVAQAGEIANNISTLNAEGISLALKTDSASVRRREEIGTITTQLTEKLNTTLDTLSKKGSGSFPSFNSAQLDRSNTDYLFYKPVLFRQGADQNYVRGIVLIRISTKNLIKSVDAARNTILVTAAIVAMIAIAIGIIGSLIVATVIVNPIRKLAAHVALVGQTRNKEKLAGHDIEITSRDEIGQLGETVNEMTHGLVKAAQDEHLLMDGKVVQQTFLPLLIDKSGNKETTAVLNDKLVQFFGYYEGASGVSGDYFDYKKLDDRWYVIIKCDASGHGVPAALIMTVVATLFRKYFENWTWKSHGTDLNKLVTQINDFIESLGLKGKFATIMICLLDTQTGEVYMCNAGDNIIHYYDAAEKKQKTVTLTETPAAGPLPSFMVDMKGGFKVEKLQLKHGDVLFLYTDGIEEATRKFRNVQFEVMKCAEPGMKDGDIHGNHKVGEESEQIEPERVQAIIEAVFAKQVYSLSKYHNPVPGEQLTFDFTSCTGTLEDAILALASVEKVFRMYKDPYVSVSDTVRVDRKIDAFLKQHFSRYDYYCSSVSDTGEEGYIYYTNLKEDEQLDDLTLVAVKKM
jgi:hypothetical protein